MIKITVPLPKSITIACSGGVDSMAIVDFLSRKHDVTIAHFNHGTQHGQKAMKFVAQYCTDNNIPLLVGHCVTEKERGQSQEEYWRNERYRFFKGLGPVITCHHLDDCVETYIFTCLRGFQSVIPYRRDNIIRPFLLNEKSTFYKWCKDKEVPFIEDETNECLDYTRNRIRHQIVPEALKVNPGLKTVVRKMISNEN